MTCKRFPDRFRFAIIVGYVLFLSRRHLFCTVLTNPSINVTFLEFETLQVVHVINLRRVFIVPRTERHAPHPDNLKGFSEISEI